MFINTPKALDSGHSIDLFNVGLILIEWGIVNSLINPKGPGSLKWDTFILFTLFEMIQSMTWHFTWWKWHDCWIFCTNMFRNGWNGHSWWSWRTGRSTTTLCLMLHFDEKKKLSGMMSEVLCDVISSSYCDFLKLFFAILKGWTFSPKASFSYYSPLTWRFF